MHKYVGARGDYICMSMLSTSEPGRRPGRLSIFNRRSDQRRGLRSPIHWSVLSRAIDCHRYREVNRPALVFVVVALLDSLSRRRFDRLGTVAYVRMCNHESESNNSACSSNNRPLAFSFGWMFGSRRKLVSWTFTSAALRSFLVYFQRLCSQTSMRQYRTTYRSRLVGWEFQEINEHSCS